MKGIYLFCLLLFLAYVPRVHAQPPYGFIRMAVDNENSFALFATFQESIVFNDTVVTVFYWPDQCIAKCDSSLNLVWFKDLDSWWLNEKVSELEFASDLQNNMYVACLVKASLQIQDTIYVNTPASRDSMKIALIKYGPSGSLIWYKESATIGPASKKIGIGLDSLNNVYISCNYSPSVSMGGDTLSKLMSYSGTFVAKFDSSGTEQWISGFSGSKHNNDYCVSRSGSMYVAGTAWSLQVCGSDTFATPPGPVPSIAAIDHSGMPLWHKTFRGAGNMTATVGVGPNEQLVVAGKFYDTIGFNSFPTFTTSDSASFVASYNNDGTERWAKKAEGVEFEELGVTSRNSIFLSGRVYGSSANIDTSSISVIPGERTIVKLDSNGRFLCNINLVKYRVEASVVGPGDALFLCGRRDIEGPSYWLPTVIGHDTIPLTSSAGIYIAEIGPGCELVTLRSINNSYVALEMVPTVDKSPSVVISPNPTSGVLNVHFANNISANCQITIGAANGSVVRKQRVRSQDVEVDVSELPPGLYFMECLNGVESTVEKFIKR